MFRCNNAVMKICSAPVLQKNSIFGISSKVDPGTRRRRKIAEEFDETDTDDLDYEANFDSLGHSYKQHTDELKVMKEKLQYDIVKQKYFKTKYPNFLTWHDKEQIRLLHKNDPEEWSIHRLSEGFPASPDIIKKIIKSNWRMDNVEKMKKHDELVRENWKKLKDNEFEYLPSDLVTHLMKFSNRKVNYHNYEDLINPKTEYTPKLTCTEFSSIISSYNELKKKKENPIAIESENDGVSNNKSISKNKTQSNVPAKGIKMKSPPQGDTFFVEPIKNTKPMTLDTLKCKLQRDAKRGRNVSSEDISIIELNQRELVESKPETIDQLEYTKYNTGKLVKVDEKKPRDYDHLVYPEKIRIPKKILKKGCTYKLNDCFYDSNGSFLYRVPGM